MPRKKESGGAFNRKGDDTKQSGELSKSQKEHLERAKKAEE